MASPLAEPGTWNAVVDPYERVLVPVFARFAARALALADVPDGGAIVDVACGPGTLSVQAAPRLHVSALDFAPDMLARLRRRAETAGVAVDARPGDGQALPWTDASFDAAFSLFGLVFFPDPARGLAELARVTRPGGRVVVSGWRPMDPKLARAVEVVFAAIGPSLPARPPFADDDDIRARFAAAGLSRVDVHPAVERVPYPTTAAFLDDLVDSNAFLLVVRARLGEAWPALEADLRAAVHERWGDGPQEMVYDAWIAVGTR